MFDGMDANKDGKVTAAEMRGMHEKMMGKTATPTTLSAAEKIKVIDSDGDGVLSQTEHAAGAKAMFARMDGDRDGFLSEQEIAAGHAAMLTKKK